MKSKAIARIVPINDDGDGRLPFYARTVMETIGGFEGVEIDGSGYACKKAWWKIEMLPSEWSSEGLPPAGTECEFKWLNDHWRIGIVCYLSKHTALISSGSEEDDGEFAYSANEVKFRPIRSARDKAIEALSLVILESHADDDEDMNTETYIYDAIAAGKIPGVRLDD